MTRINTNAPSDRKIFLKIIWGLMVVTIDPGAFSYKCEAILLRIKCG